MVSAYSHAQERGWNPVINGRAPWLPVVYEHAVAFVGSVYAEHMEKARKRAEARRGRH